MIRGHDSLDLTYKTKTDPIDSAIIADMLRHSEPPQASEIQDMQLFQLRELVRVRHRLIEKQAELDPIMSIEIKALITQLELYDEQIHSIEGKIDQR